MVILGVLVVIWPGISTLAVDIYVGWLFLLSGIVGIVSMFLAQNVQAFLWSLLTAALSLFVGIVLLWHPVEGAVSLTSGAHRLLHRRRCLPDSGISQLSRRVPRPVGMDVGKRHRRSALGRADHQRLAQHSRMGAGLDRRHQPGHVRRSHRHGGACREKPGPDGGEGRSLSLH